MAKRRSYLRVDHATRIAMYRECAAAEMTAAQTAEKMGITLQNLYVWKSDTQKKKRIKLPPTAVAYRPARVQRPALKRAPLALTFVMNVSVGEPALN